MKKRFLVSIILTIGSFFLEGANLAYSDEKPEAISSPSPESKTDDIGESSTVAFAMPLVSFVLPGFHQWVSGQKTHATAYTGVGLFGLVYAKMHADKIVRSGQKGNANQTQAGKSDFPIHNESQRKVDFGLQLNLAAGSFSAYKSFRTVAARQKKMGLFQFFTREESPLEILKAPFEFSFLKNPRTYIPIGIAASIFALTLATDFSKVEGKDRNFLNISDAFFASAFSLNAGTHEEVLFRGWLMPLIMEWTGSAFWSNAAASILFGAAHLQSVDLPIFQTAFGWHLGGVTIDNDWSLSESVFIHTWWDVFIFLTIYQSKYASLPQSIPVLWLPSLTWHF